MDQAINTRPSSPLSTPPPASSPCRSRSKSPSFIPPPPTRQRRSRHRKSGRRSPHPRSEKLDRIHQEIKRWGWTFTDVLEAYSRESENAEYRPFWLQFKRFAYSRTPLDRGDWNKVLGACGIDYVAHDFRLELKKLGQSASFGGFRYPQAGKELDLGSLAFLEDLDHKDLDTHAPKLKRFLCQLSRPLSKTTAETVKWGPMHTAWISMLLYAMARKKFNNIPRLFGLYLVNSGAKKRLVDTMSSIGLCASFTTVQDTQKAITNVGEKQIACLASDPTVNKAHDNFDFPEHRSGERIGQKKTFVSLTNGIISKGHHLPSAGLKQSMWHPERPLLTSKIIGNIAACQYWYEVSILGFPPDKAI